MVADAIKTSLLPNPLTKSAMRRNNMLSVVCNVENSYRYGAKCVVQQRAEFLAM